MWATEASGSAAWKPSIKPSPALRIGTRTMGMARVGKSAFSMGVWTSMSTVVNLSVTEGTIIMDISWVSLLNSAGLVDSQRSCVILELMTGWLRILIMETFIKCT